MGGLSSFCAMPRRPTLLVGPMPPPTPPTVEVPAVARVHGRSGALGPRWPVYTPGGQAGGHQSTTSGMAANPKDARLRELQFLAKLERAGQLEIPSTQDLDD